MVPHQPIPLQYEVPADDCIPRQERGVGWAMVLPLIVVGLVTIWWQVGIRVGRAITGERYLFVNATGTRLWDTWVVDAPFYALNGGIVTVALLTLVMVILRRWGWWCVWLLLFWQPACWIIALVVNMPLVFDANP